MDTLGRLPIKRQFGVRIVPLVESSIRFLLEKLVIRKIQQGRPNRIPDKEDTRRLFALLPGRRTPNPCDGTDKGGSRD